MISVANGKYDRTHSQRSRMIEVIPLRYGKVFKRIFSEPKVFRQFVEDVLGIRLNIERVHTEYEYPEPVGFVRSRYDLFAEDPAQRIVVEIQHVKEEDFFDRFLYYHLISLVEQVRGFQAYGFERTVYTIVVLTSVPQDGSVNFSCAVSDMSPVDEFGRKVSVYPHRLVFLSPRQVNEQTPPSIRKWLDFITDSLDGSMEESQYNDSLFQEMMESIRKQTIDPDELAEIKDEAAWERAKARFAAEGREEGRKKGREEEKLAQQRAIAFQAKQMGMDESAIATLIGVPEVAVREMLALSQDHNNS